MIERRVSPARHKSGMKGILDHTCIIHPAIIKANSLIELSLCTFRFKEVRFFLEPNETHDKISNRLIIFFIFREYFGCPLLHMT